MESGREKVVDVAFEEMASKTKRSFYIIGTSYPIPSPCALRRRFALFRSSPRAVNDLGLSSRCRHSNADFRCCPTWSARAREDTEQEPPWTSCRVANSVLGADTFESGVGGVRWTGRFDEYLRPI